MGELMIHDVVPELGVPPAAPHGIPRQDHRPSPVCLADMRKYGPLDAWDGKDRGLWPARNERRRINQDRLDVGVKLLALETIDEPQHEQASLPGDGDLDLVGEHEAVAALPMLLGHEDLYQLGQALLLARVEVAEVHHVAPERARPFLGERCFQ
jgi:hypothetical protein